MNEKIKNLFYPFEPRDYLKIFGVFLILLVIPLTIYLNLSFKDLRSRAATQKNVPEIVPKKESKVTIDKSPKIIRPSNLSKVAGLVTIELSGQIEGSKVEYWLNNTKLVGPASDPPYKFIWNSLTVPDGSYLIVARFVQEATIISTSQVRLSVSNPANTTLEEALSSLILMQRDLNKLNPLQRDLTLTTIARERSRDLVDSLLSSKSKEPKEQLLLLLEKYSLKPAFAEEILIRDDSPHFASSQSSLQEIKGDQESLNLILRPDIDKFGVGVVRDQEDAKYYTIIVIKE